MEGLQNILSTIFGGKPVEVEHQVSDQTTERILNDVVVPSVALLFVLIVVSLLLKKYVIK